MPLKRYICNISSFPNAQTVWASQSSTLAVLGRICSVGETAPTSGHAHVAPPRARSADPDVPRFAHRHYPPLELRAGTITLKTYIVLVNTRVWQLAYLHVKSGFHYELRWNFVTILFWKQQFLTHASLITAQSSPTDSHHDELMTNVLSLGDCLYDNINIITLCSLRKCILMASLQWNNKW